MPVISFDYKDFLKLVGKKYSLKELEETMPMMGMEWEGVNGDEISVEVFPNRPDLLSVEGLARAYKSFRGLKTGLIHYSARDSDYEIIVDESVKNVRPIIAGAVIKGVKLNDDTVKSLMQLQEKLHLTHCRRRKKAAIGVHDLRIIKFPVRYTAVNPDSIKFIPLDSTMELTPEEILINHPKGVKYANLLEGKNKYPLVLSDDGEVLSFPPIINSELTKVRPNTKDLFIEVTGTDEFIVSKALNIVVTSLLERGAKAYKVLVKHGKTVNNYPKLDSEVMSLSTDYCRKLLGENIPDKSIPVLLRKMGYDVERNDKELLVSIPCYRTDIMHPMDLVEDVAISYGYQNFAPTIPKTPGVGKGDYLFDRYEYVRDVMAGFGFIEVYNWLLTSKKVLFDNLLLPEHRVVEIMKPKTEDLTVCRDSLLPQLIEFLGKNKHNDYPQKVFEVGEVLDYSSSNVKQEMRLSVASAHSKANYSELKAVIDTLLKELGLKAELRDVSKPYYIDGRAAELIVNGAVIGELGELNPEVLNNYELRVPVVIAELKIEELIK